MINYSKNKYNKSNYKNIDFLFIDARNINFEKEFNIIFSTATLHWINDQLTVLKKIKKALKPDGKVFLQMGGKGNQEDLIAIVENIIKKEKWKSYFKDFTNLFWYFDKDEYMNWILEAGLKAKRVELIDKDMTQIGKEGLFDWIRTAFSSYIQRVQENEKNILINEIAEDYIQKYPLDKNNICHVKMKRLEVEAQV